jgi:CO/xanthine dehydrogenase Mo-binding subunit
VIFEQNKPLVFEALGNVEFDDIGSASEVFETEFFRFIKAKEIGEGLLIATIPAITNAIYDAIDVRIKDLPVTPEKILEDLEKKA